MAKSGGQEEIRETTRIPPEFRPFAIGLARNAARARQQVQGLGPFTGIPEGERTGAPTGALIARTDPRVLEAREATLGLGRELAPIGLASSGADLASRTLSGEFLDPNQAFIQNQISASTAPVLDAAEQARQRRESLAEFAGASGGTRQAIADAIANRETQRVIGEIASNVVSANIDRERRLQQLAPELATGALQAGLMPIGLIEAAGTGFQADAQREIDEAIGLRREAEDFPFRALERESGIIGGIPMGSDVTRTVPSGQSQGAQALAGGAGGAAAAASLAAALAPATGGTSLALIAALGGLGGAGATFL